MSFTETLSDDHASANRAERTGKSLGRTLVEVIRKRNDKKYVVYTREDIEEMDWDKPRLTPDMDGYKFFVCKKGWQLKQGLEQTVVRSFPAQVEAAYNDADSAFRFAENLNVEFGG